MTMSNVPDRFFGVEIECVFPSGDYAMRKASEALRAAGLRAESSSYPNTSSWGVKTDGSIRGNGVEVVSPKLKGAAGIEEVTKAVRALSEAGAEVNVSCGLHVHVDTTGMSVASIVNVVERYRAHERTMDSFMPNSRRANNNNFTQSVGMFDRTRNIATHLAAAVKEDNRSTLRDFAGRTDRYCKVNLQAFWKYGTIEFRQHSGTVNSEKIENWICFVLFFVEASVVEQKETTESYTETETTVVSEQVPSARRVSKHEKSLRAINDVLQARQCVALSTLASETGLTINTVTMYLSKLRNEHGVRTSTRNGIAYLRGGNLPALTETSTRQVPTTVTKTRTVKVWELPNLDADRWERGIPERVQRFYRERAMELDVARLAA